MLSAKGSLYATRPTLVTYTAKREDLLANANELFDVVVEGHRQDQRQPHLSAEGRGAGASRPGGPQDHRLDRAAALIAAAAWPFSPWGKVPEGG